MSPDDPRHGSYAGASEHRKTGAPMCAPCLRAERHTHALTIADRLAGKPRTVPALGTVRRIHALQAIGWTIADIARQSGLYEKTLRNPICRGGSVYRATAEAVSETYERICMVRPTGPYHERCRRVAARRGYAPPLAWDDIDDPAARPHGIPTPTRKEASEWLVEDWDLLRRHGYTRRAAAEYMGITKKRLEKAIERQSRRLKEAS